MVAQPDLHAQNKRLVHLGLTAAAAQPPAEARRTLASLYAAELDCHIAHPIDALSGAEGVVAGFWEPLKAAVPDLSRRDTMLLAGTYADRTMVACLGYYVGTFERDWLGIPAHGKLAWIRYGEVHEVAEGRIVRCWMLPDLLDLMRQAGAWPLVPSLGSEGFWPAPARGFHADPGRRDAQAGARSLDLILRMQAGLLCYDGRDLASMDHARYWKTDFFWFGPAGIGTTRGLGNFETAHQIPFLNAFPDRGLAGEHLIELGDGDCAVTGGWGSLAATHGGGGFLGMPATGKRVGMRVMDFYRVEDGLIAENWVPFDILDLLRQLGYDPMERLARFRCRR